MPAYNKGDIERRMRGAVESLKHDLQGLRTGRASASHEWIVKPFGANQCEMCSARVQQSNTRLRGASNTRVRATVCSFIS